MAKGAEMKVQTGFTIGLLSMLAVAIIDDFLGLSWISIGLYIIIGLVGGCLVNYYEDKL
jgi:hypothetical protein